MRADVHTALLALLVAATLASAAAARDVMAIGQWAIDSPAFGGPHARAEYELPDGVKPNTPAADQCVRHLSPVLGMTALTPPSQLLCATRVLSRFPPALALAAHSVHP